MFLLLMLQYPVLLFAQRYKEQADSCLKLLPSTPDDSSKVNLTFSAGEDFWFARQLPEAIQMLEQSIVLAGKYNFFNQAANARLLLASAFINTGHYDSAFDYLLAAREWAKKLKQPEHLPKIDLGYAYLYNLLGDEKKAISFGLAAADGFEKNKAAEISIQSIYAWIEVGRIFEREQQYEKALYYYSKARNKGQKEGMGEDWYIKPPLINIANVYVKQSRLAEARLLYRQVLELDSTGYDIENSSSALKGLGDVAIQEKNYAKAVDYFKKALQYARAYNIRPDIDDFLCGAGYAFLLNRQYDSAARYLQEGLVAAKATGDNNMISTAYEHLSQLYEKQRDFATALHYARLHKATADSIYNSNKMTVLNNLEILYQTNQKEKQIITLQANNAEEQLELVKRSRMLLATGIAICALVIIFLLFYYNSRHKQMIAAQQQLLQEKKIGGLEQQQKMVALQNLVAGQEAERRRVARDLHDGLGGLFATVKMHLSALRHMHITLRDDELFNKSYALVNNATDELRRIAHNMMPEALVKLGLVQALKDFCDNINAKGFLIISFQAYGMEERLPVETEIIIFRIIQELVTNILKHARATTAIVQLNRDGPNLYVVVEDSGVGFDVSGVALKPHAGLDNIKTRISYLNGVIGIDSKPGAGATITMEFPVV